MTATLAAEQALNGLQLGLMLFLMAAGLTLVLGIMDTINLAHGSLYMVGAYLAAAFFQATGSFLAALVLAVAATALLGAVLEVAILRRLYRRDHLSQVLATFAVILIANETVRMIWGSQPIELSIPRPFSGPVDLAPGFSADEDVIKAAGDSMNGMYNASQWAHDLPNPENRKFVADFEKEYGRLPSLYASQGYDAALLIDAAVRKVKGNLDNKEALRSALAAAEFKSVRGAFRFNRNQYPVQDYYLRVVEKDAKGRVTNRTVGTIFRDHADAYAAECAMK